ncbi:glycosyltransferase [Rubrivivax rivuli]|uniref:glycosyltransferase n=1 Tax=Rubrivivax rivuli TaxID=1862385 RepID=UPI0013E3DC72|nr:glycosyltransferase [Rubrivivax rivuli]
MRRVLFIAYLYPPIANSGTRRSIEFANHLPDNGWEPVVLTISNPDSRPDRYDPELLSDVRAGTRVERAPLATEAWAQRLGALLPAPMGTRVAASLAWRLPALWKVPDDVAAWRSSAAALGIKLHREQPFDAIYASGSPWTSFLVARDISRATGVPYVIDYRDMWSPSGDAPWEQETRLQRRFRPHLERKTARDAAAVVTVTKALVENIGARVGRDDLRCITNGFEPADFAGLPQPVDDGKVRVSYTGVWRMGYGPELLYRALRLAKLRQAPWLDCLAVDAAGFKPGPAHEFGIEDRVTEHGRVSHAQALGMMGRSNAVFLPVSEGFYASASLPGKLFEYIGSQRPIIAAAPANSEVARVLDDVGGAWRLERDDEEGLLAVLQSLCTDGAYTGFTPRRSERLITYTRAATARQLADVLDEVQARPHPGRAGA